LADLRDVVAEVVEPRQLGERLEPEHPLEEPGRPVADGAARGVLAPSFGDQPALDQAGHGRVGRDAADAGDLRPRARPEVRDDRERLEPGLREAALHRPLEQPRARLRRLAGGPERVAACDVLEDDAAPPLRVPLREQAERDLDALRVLVRGLRELADVERLGGDHEQSLDRPRERVDRIGGDQAEWAIHESVLSTSAREILIGANGAAWSIAISPPLRSSSRARNATATSTRESPSTSASKSKRRRRRSSARKRSTNWPTGGKRIAMCASDTGGGSTASAQRRVASSAGSCAASRRSGRGASGAGPRRK